MNKTILEKCYYPFLDWIKKETVLPYLDSLQRSQYFPLRTLQEIQLNKFRQLIRHAYQNIPFYHRMMHNHHLTPDDFQSLDQLAKMPTIGKTDVRDNLTAFLDPTYRGKIYTGSTSGSTGIPLKLYHTPDYSSWDWASRWRARAWFGVELGDREVALWGRPVHSAWARRWGAFKARLRNVLLLSGFNLSDTDLAKHWKKIIRFQPDYIYGYASSLAQLGLFVERYVQPESRLNLKAIFTAGETLHLPDKKNLEELFSCKVANEYGCSEVGAFAYECPEGNWHISAENVIVEYLDKNGNPADKGEIAVTSLTNFYMPLIRYRLGDQGMHIAQPCPCGRTLPLMKLTAARIVDVIKTRNGRVFSSNLFDYINDALLETGVKGIKQFRVIQNDYADFVIQIVREDYLEEKALEFFGSKMREYLGSDISIKYEFVPSIPQDPTGKIRSFISNIT